jgi:hypothetical protein
MGGPSVDEMFLENLEEFVYDENRIVCLFLININNPYKLYFFGYEVLLETRSSRKDSYRQIQCNKDSYKFSFFCQTIKDWNKLSLVLSSSI